MREPQDAAKGTFFLSLAGTVSLTLSQCASYTGALVRGALRAPNTGASRLFCCAPFKTVKSAFSCTIKITKKQKRSLSDRSDLFLLLPTEIPARRY